MNMDNIGKTMKKYGNQCEFRREQGAPFFFENNFLSDPRPLMKYKPSFFSDMKPQN